MLVRSLLQSKRDIRWVRDRVVEREQYDVHLVEPMPFVFGRREPQADIRALRPAAAADTRRLARIIRDFALLAEHIQDLSSEKQGSGSGIPVSSKARFGMPRSSRKRIAALGVVCS